MKKQIQNVIILMVFIFFCTSGLFTKVTEFFVWLVTLHYSNSEISAIGEIFVKVASFLVSFGAVGVIFELIGFHDKKLMSWSYYLISTLLSFVLCYIVMIFEKNLLVISIILGVLLALIIIFIINIEIKDKKKKLNKEA